MPENAHPPEILEMHAEMLTLRQKYNLKGLGIYWVNAQNHLCTIEDDGHEFTKTLHELLRMYIADNVALAKEAGEDDAFHIHGGF